MQEHGMDQKNLDIYGDPPLPWWIRLRRVGERRHHRCEENLLAGQPPPPTGGHTSREWARSGLIGARLPGGEGTRKSHNLAENAHCAISVNLPTLDLVIEGTASRVTDRATLQDSGALRGAGMASQRGRGRHHRRIQRAERRTISLEPLRHDACCSIWRGD